MKTTTKYKVPFPKQINLLPTRPYTKHVGMVPSVHNYHLEMKSSVRISRMEVWRPGVYFQTNANTSSNKHLFLSHAILLLCDIYICIWNKKNVLLCICSLSSQQGSGSFCRTTVHINTEHLPVYQPTWKCLDLCGAETQRFVCSYVCLYTCKPALLSTGLQ